MVHFNILKTAAEQLHTYLWNVRNGESAGWGGIFLSVILQPLRVGWWPAYCCWVGMLV